MSLPPPAHIPGDQISLSTSLPQVLGRRELGLPQWWGWGVGGGSPNQPRGWSRAPHPHPPAPWAGLRGPPWLGVLPPAPGPRAFAEGLWCLGLGCGDFFLLSLSFPSLLRAPLSPLVLGCFQAVSKLPRRMSFSYQKEKNVSGETSGAQPLNR